MTDAAPADVKRTVLTLADFLENQPPDTACLVNPLLATSAQGHLILAKGDIELECDSPECKGKGKLRFANVSDSVFLSRGRSCETFTNYTCRNCRTTSKSFALEIQPSTDGTSGAVRKFGEYPPFGPTVPARVITLIGPDRELFLSGRRAENRGLGIGAFAYYRRVVENQKGRIIAEMAKVAAKLEAPPADLKLFADAQNESQFSKAIDKIGRAIPTALHLSGQNPLTLLHAALSDGLHERSDEECLECAREIRLLLTELAERMAQVLKDESEIQGAVNKLLARNAAKKKPNLEKAESVADDRKVNS